MPNPKTKPDFTALRGAPAAVASCRFCGVAGYRLKRVRPAGAPARLAISHRAAGVRLPCGTRRRSSALRARGAGSNRRRRPLRHAADVSNAERPWRAQQRATRTRECPPLRPRPAAGCFRSTLRDGSSAPAVRELDGRAPDPSAGTPARPPQPLACRTRPPPARPFSVRRSSRHPRRVADTPSLARAARLNLRQRGGVRRCACPQRR